MAQVPLSAGPNPIPEIILDALCRAIEQAAEATGYVAAFKYSDHVLIVSTQVARVSVSINGKNRFVVSDRSYSSFTQFENSMTGLKQLGIFVTEVLRASTPIGHEPIAFVHNFSGEVRWISPDLTVRELREMGVTSIRFTKKPEGLPPGWYVEQSKV